MYSMMPSTSLSDGYLSRAKMTVLTSIVKSMKYLKAIKLCYQKKIWLFLRIDSHKDDRVRPTSFVSPLATWLRIML